MKKKNAFTLIELIAVLVILAVIALIVTPLVLNIVKKAKDSANKRSVDAYGKAVELAVATYLLDTGDYPTTIEDLTVEYTGNEVVCNVKALNEDGSIYLSECTVKGTEVKDSKTDDGWYHYGKTTSNVVTYDTYKIGDTVTYNGMDFYVIENSDTSSDSVTLLKAEPLTVEEVNTYGAGHINNYTPSKGVVDDQNGYGGMAYYSSKDCMPSAGSFGDCTSDYDLSEIKYAVDGWSEDKIIQSDLKEDQLGYKVRLITKEEIISGFDYEENLTPSISFYEIGQNTPEWIYNNNYYYWTMTEYGEDQVWIIDKEGTLTINVVDEESYGQGGGVVRPVITLLKSAI